MAAAAAADKGQEQSGEQREHCGILRGWAGLRKNVVAQSMTKMDSAVRSMTEQRKHREKLSYTIFPHLLSRYSTVASKTRDSTKLKRNQQETSKKPHHTT